MADQFTCAACGLVYQAKRTRTRHYQTHHSDLVERHGVESIEAALTALNMEEGSGRGHREKIPSAKLKDLVHGKVESKPEPDKSRIVVPAYIAPNLAGFTQEQREVAKIYDITKIGPNGEKTEFYSLGNHVESKDKRYYMRAKRDPETFYFHTAETAPFYARLSDENHPQCAIEKLNNGFTKDMLGKTGESGSYTTRANVFAREGQFFFEAKVISQALPGKEPPKVALAAMQSPDRTGTNRGGIRVGFCRREHHYGENLGTNAYSYAAVLRCGTAADYGNVRFNTFMRHIKGTDFGDLQPGDVVGLMITLPPLEVQKKVVDGTFNSADYPDLECGPAKPKAKGKSGKRMAKTTGGKAKEVAETIKPKDKAEGEKEDLRSKLRAELQPQYGLNLPVDLDIIRDRNPFLHKNTMCYFECPEYTPHVDLSRPTLNSKNKSVNPETGKVYDLEVDAHPNHELPHLRTLPGSKIEIWVNGKYHGILWEHLFGFLPPASTIDKSSRSTIHGAVDDGLLGYYPAISHYTGGAVECKFDGPWWCGYDDGPARPDCRPVGVRYKEQIVEDAVCDIIDEIYLEKAHGDRDWLKKEVAKMAPSRE